MESLFKRLFLYRSTEKRRAWEDWLTESFAAVLDHDPRLSTASRRAFALRDQPSSTWTVGMVFFGDGGSFALPSTPRRF